MQDLKLLSQWCSTYSQLCRMFRCAMPVARVAGEGGGGGGKKAGGWGGGINNKGKQAQYPM